MSRGPRKPQYGSVRRNGRKGHPAPGIVLPRGQTNRGQPPGSQVAVQTGTYCRFVIGAFRVSGDWGGG